MPGPHSENPTRRTARDTGLRAPRRSTFTRPPFVVTLRALEEVAEAGAQVSLHVVDLDRGSTVVSGDAHRTLPVGGLGVVPLLVEVAARIETGDLDPLEILDRSGIEPVSVAGVWRHLKAPALPVVDLAVLAAASGDALAANLLLQRVGAEAVLRRTVEIGMPRSGLLDGFRDTRGPDDAPHVALGTTAEFAEVFSALVNSRVVSPAVSAQVAEWLSLNQDLSLAGAATALDPFGHEDDRHRLLFLNKTGRADGVRAEAGVLAGPRAGVAYALIVCFDDLSIAHRMRAHEVFRTFGADLMEHVF